MRPGGTTLHERWGSARSSKVVRAYAKFEASSFRIEFQLNARFLRKHQINHASDFAKLATILSSHHICFATLDDNKLRRALAAQQPASQNKNRNSEIGRGESEKFVVNTTSSATQVAFHKCAPTAFTAYRDEWD